ncbi:hypothetical protein [Amycolatopsis sp. PS_44_ISF1]|uniref:hypothetical protein n=1 Tax=Amycolatopsis sp. PS_44_ISF1 TaxID=2974917 RepID=UPI0028DFA7DE|nr:hypothetical protein [Amycolatopsis sp. PS_44_ISF1]MDT8910433.1 hypothetical protein [Amycolatopsis sp. PS_44_ISF1]
MTVNLNAAASFLATHARVLERRRFELLTGEVIPQAVLGAVEGYRNADGGYGWGLEPDLRAPESQPGGALHAFEVFEQIAPATTPLAAELCDWLTSVSLPGGGLPFAFPVADPAGCAPFWTQAVPTFSLQSTAFVAGTALRVAAHDGAVAEHPWLAEATRTCIEAIRRIDSAPHAIELSFAIRFLDAAHATRPEAAELLDHLGKFLPDNGILHVAGGSAEEFMRPLDFAPNPGPARRLFDDRAVERELDDLEAGQQDDGGWPVVFASYSPAATLEWRGYTTVNAIRVLNANSRVTW